MRILLITRYMPPMDSIATHRMYSFAKELADNGHQVTAITTTKTGQIVTPWHFDTSMFELVEIDYFDPFVALGLSKTEVVQAKSRSWTSKLKNLYTKRFSPRIPCRTDLWMFPAKRLLRKWKKEGREFDLVLSSYGPPVAHIVGAFAKKLFRCPWIADYRDLWLENPVAKGMWPFTLFEALLEKFLLKRADLITTISEGHSAVLQKKFPKTKHSVIMNGFEPSMLEKASREYFKGDKIRIVYTGSMYAPIHSPLPLFRALKEMKERDRFEVLLYGRFPSEIEDLVRSEGVEDFVHFKGIVPLEESHSIQASADFLLYIQSPDPSVKGVISGKLFEYLYSPAPILAIGSSPTYCPNKLIDEVNGGYNCGSDPSAIASVLRLALTGNHFKEKNRKQLEKYTRKNQARKLLDYVHSL